MRHLFEMESRVDRVKKQDGKEVRVAKEYVASLSDEHRLLIILKSQLYSGKWEPMLHDLKNRLAGKPYIFKLANRIQDDIERIEQMRLFEAEHLVDLSNYITLE